jgi:hypothetical protein
MPIPNSQSEPTGLTPWILVSGAHRLEAARQARLEKAPCIVSTCTDADRELGEITENLIATFCVSGVGIMAPSGLLCGGLTEVASSGNVTASRASPRIARNAQGNAMAECDSSFWRPRAIVPGPVD